MKPGRVLRAHQDILALTVVIVAIVGASLFWNAHQVGQIRKVTAANHMLIGRLDAVTRKLQREVRAECGLNLDLATIPLAVSVSTHKVPELGVQVVLHARDAYRTASCPVASLPPPSRELRHWAAYYRLHVR